MVDQRLDKAMHDLESCIGALENSGKVCRWRTTQVVKLKTALELIRDHASGTSGVNGTFSRPIFDIADAALKELEELYANR